MIVFLEKVKNSWMNMEMIQEIILFGLKCKKVWRIEFSGILKNRLINLLLKIRVQIKEK